MIMYGIDNIRELVGHKINIQMVHDNPICRLTRPEALETCYVDESEGHWYGHIAH